MPLSAKEVHASDIQVVRPRRPLVEFIATGLLAVLRSILPIMSSRLSTGKSIEVPCEDILTPEIPASQAQREALADRAVEHMAAGFKVAQSTGKFPKVY
jgi:hypothetical protein